MRCRHRFRRQRWRESSLKRRRPLLCIRLVPRHSSCRPVSFLLGPFSAYLGLSAAFYGLCKPSEPRQSAGRSLPTASTFYRRRRGQECRGASCRRAAARGRSSGPASSRRRAAAQCRLSSDHRLPDSAAPNDSRAWPPPQSPVERNSATLLDACREGLAAAALCRRCTGGQAPLGSSR